MNIIVDAGDENPAADTLNGVYERHRIMQRGDKILDLGAHKGYFSLLASSRVGATGCVVAFEPHPGNFEKLSIRCHCTNVICINAGAWDEDGYGELWPSIDNSGGHSFWRVPAGQADKPIDCLLYDIGAWLKRLGFRPDFVKIDTELSELHILTSLMRTDLRPEIAAEIHNLEMWNACRELLKRHGYHLLPESEEFTNYYLFAWQS